MCASGLEHLILIDRSGAAWSWGRGPQTGRIKVGAEVEDEVGGGQIALTRIDFFQVYWSGRFSVFSRVRYNLTSCFRA